MAFRVNSNSGRIPLSDLHNPLLDPTLPAGLPPENPPLARVPAENPLWGIVEIVGIVVVGFAALFFLLIVVIALAHRFLYPQESFMQVPQDHPILLIATQTLDYLVVVLFMAFLVRRTSSQSFAGGIRWNWPANPWAYLMGGVCLSLSLVFVEHFLPIPKDLPMDRFFRTPLEAWGVAVFGLFFAPLIEELFFRGFLYPVLARRLGMVASIVITALGFGLVHASQLGHAWGPVLIIFLVGVALTTVRAVTKSVAAGWLMHFAYNGTIFSMMFIATSGFRHMERLTQ